MSSIEPALQHVRLHLEPAIGFVASKLGLSRPDSELILYTVLTVLLLQLLTSIFFPSRPEKPVCCISKFVQQRKSTSGPISIPPNMSGGSASSGGVSDSVMNELRQLLSQIHGELQQMRQEREVVEQELIETSTQILQAIGASLVPMEDDEGDLVDPSPPIVKPVPTRPAPDRPIIADSPVVKSVSERPAVQLQTDSPVVIQREPVHSAPVKLPLVAPTAPVAPSVVSVGSSSPASGLTATAKIPVKTAPAVPSVPQSKPAQTPVRVPQPVEPKVAPVDPSPASGRMEPAAVPKQVPVAVAPPVAKAPTADVEPAEAPSTGPPKMSALALARMKREQELAQAKTGQAPVPQPGVGNPFSKPASGPFAARTTAQ
jgi:hypothetical protein